MKRKAEQFIPLILRNRTIRRDYAAAKSTPKRKSPAQRKSGDESNRKKMCSTPAPEISKSELVLPDELIIEILCELPFKSILRFKCVCKLWHGIIQERSFIDKQMMSNERIYVYKSDLDTDCRDGETFSYMTTNDGLVVEKSNSNPPKHRIRNPWTKQVLYLPNPRDQQCFQFQLTYVPNANKYKLTYVYYEEGNKFGGCRVLTIGTDLSWRSLDIPHPNKLWSDRKRVSARRIDDVLFITDGHSEIVCIEMESECITSVKIPDDLFLDGRCERFRVLFYEFKFSLAKIEEEKLTVCVLENYKEQKWSESKIVISLDKLRKSYPKLKELHFQTVYDDWLWVFADNELHFAYHITSGEIHISSASPEKNIAYYFRPTLVHLEGMQSEQVSC